MNNQATMKMTDNGGKPDVCPKHDNGNPSFVPKETKAIDIKCLSPLSDKGKKKPLSDEDPNDPRNGIFAKKKFDLNQKGCRILLLRVLEQAKEDWYEAMKKLEKNEDDSDAYETVCEVEDYLTGDDYRGYREICDQLPENPLQMFLERWARTHFWEEMEKPSAKEIDY